MTTAAPALVWLVRPGSGADHRALGRDLARDALAQVLGVPPDDVTVGREPGADPCPQGAYAGAASLSITHTVDLVAVAVAAGAVPLGVDAERIRRVPAATAIARRRFHPAEAARLAGLDDPDRTLEFLRMWAVKEAYAKALGAGLAIPLSTCRVDGPGVIAPPPPGGGRWLVGVESPAPGQAGHVLAVVLADAARGPHHVEIRVGSPGADARPPRQLSLVGR